MVPELDMRLTCAGKLVEQPQDRGTQKRGRDRNGMQHAVQTRSIKRTRRKTMLKLWSAMQTLAPKDSLTSEKGPRNLARLGP